MRSLACPWPALAVMLLAFRPVTAADAAPPAAGPAVVPAAELQRWHEIKAAGGPTFAGSPAWRAHLEFVERELRSRGVVDLAREPVPYRRWFTADDAAAGQWSLTVDGKPVPVASYWAYSGS